MLRNHNCKIKLPGLRAARFVLLLLAPSVGKPQNNSAQEPQDILAFLNQSIVWYRQLSAQQQTATESSDILLLDQNRQLADEAVRLSFEFARARAQVLPGAVTADQNPGNNSDASGASSASRYQNLLNAAAKTDAQVKQQQQLIESLKKQLSAASGSKQRLSLQTQIADEQSELELMQARAETLHSLIDFTAGAKAKGTKSGSLQAQIEELARTLPGVAMETKPQATGTTAAAAPIVTASSAPKSEGSGLFGLFSNMFRLRQKVSTLDEGLQLTDSVAGLSQSLRAPLVKDLRDLTQRGDVLTSQPDSPDPAVMSQHRNEVDALTAEYKKLSASVLPIGKQALLLDLYKRNLATWRAAAHSQYSSALKSLVFRLALLALILGVVLAISELWRRATFRYIQDKRRRFQFLLMRRIVVWSLIAVIVVLAFASEIGSLATFAGLLTAGLAVALQNVILSIVGYFFLIGKYGVRVGDRIQVAGVTGNIIDIGLMRLHLMEVGGFGPGIRPTGRVVVFPNAVVFQANSGLFKQAPGAKFVWHEMRLKLAPNSDYQEVEKRMLEAVNSVFAEYKENIAQQHRHMAVALAPLTISSPEPETRLDLSGGGLTVSVRYPVDLDGATEIDDRITRAVLNATMREPKLHIVEADAPKVEEAAIEEP